MMYEKFKTQLEISEVVTEEILLRMTNKTYHNGDEVKIGDKTLYGLIVNRIDVGNIDVDMVMLNENHLDLYELDNTPYEVKFPQSLPLIKLK